MKTVFTLSVIFLFLNVHAQTQNKAGTPDSSFGKQGFIAGKLAGQVNTIIQQEDGKLLAAGSFEEKYSIARFLNDGSLDSSFGNNGFTISNPAGGANKMLLTADGKILICGGYAKKNTLQFFVARFTTTGKLDSSFGKNGTTIIPLFHKADGYSEIALNSDGSIIIGGFGTNNIGTLDSQYSIISKLSPDGKFDNTFGKNGYVLNLTSTDMKDLTIQQDGKIVTCGTNMGYDFVFSRYNADGSLDKSFGNNGNVVLVVGGDDEAEKIIIQPNGKLMIGGYTSLGKYKMCALRLNSDGSLDETFGDSGKALIDFEDSTSRAYDMVQQPDGKFILAGAAYDLGQNGGYFGLCRITSDGKLDSSFGINGLQTTAYSDGGEAYCAAIQTDGKIVLGGYYLEINQDGNTAPYLMVRYNNNISRKQIIITKIRRWLQHHNGIEWNNLNGVSSYVVQRSYDGIHFNTIATIHAGNTSNYTYEDASPLSNTNYYRLQTTSVSSDVNYSNVIAITNDDIKISPNPATNTLRIQVLPSHQKIKLTVVDFAGNVRLQTITNNGDYNLNIASLKAGNYLLKIETNDDVVTKQFVKE